MLPKVSNRTLAGAGGPETQAPLPSSRPCVGRRPRGAPTAVPLSAQVEGVRFREATALGQEDIAAVQDAVRKRVLRLFERRGLPQTKGRQQIVRGYPTSNLFPTLPMVLALRSKCEDGWLLRSPSNACPGTNCALLFANVTAAYDDRMRMQQPYRGVLNLVQLTSVPGKSRAVGPWWASLV